MLRAMWRAASRPRVWFEQLEQAAPRLGRAYLVALVSLVTGSLGIALALVLITASDAYLVIFSAAAAFGLLIGSLVWGLGGLIAQTLGRLDLRAYELVGWSWSPAFFMFASLLPATLIVPVAALPVGILGALAWHFVLLHAGLRAFDAPRPLLILASYVVAGYGFPMGIALFLVWALGGFP